MFGGINRFFPIKIDLTMRIDVVNHDDDVVVLLLKREKASR